MSGRRIAFEGMVPRVADEAFVADNAVLIGDIEVGAGASIWFGAVLRADRAPIRIGENTNIQDGCVMHADPGFPVSIAPGVTVGHRAIVHGATVESGVLVGMGSILLNGCVIGSRTLIAAGAVVREGDQIPPNSLVAGVPARVIRALDADTLARISKSALSYVELAETYRAMSLDTLG